MDVGDRIVVCAAADQGADHKYDGRIGVVLDLDHMVVSIRFDDPPSPWPALNVICRQNVRPSGLPPQL